MKDPTLFGQAMQSRDDPFKPPLFRLDIGNGLSACVWQRDTGEWVSRVEGASSAFISTTHPNPSEATAAIEQRIRALVAALGHLVHLRCDASLDPRWCAVCGIFTQGKSCPDHPDAPSHTTDPHEGR